METNELMNYKWMDICTWCPKKKLLLEPCLTTSHHFFNIHRCSNRKIMIQLVIDQSISILKVTFWDTLSIRLYTIYSIVKIEFNNWSLKKYLQSCRQCLYYNVFDNPRQVFVAILARTVKLDCAPMSPASSFFLCWIFAKTRRFSKCPLYFPFLWRVFANKAL